MSDPTGPEQPSPVDAFFRSTGPLINVSVVDDTDPEAQVDATVAALRENKEAIMRLEGERG